MIDDLRDVVNWEVWLSRDAADRGVRPPLDVARCGVRRPERLLESAELHARAQFRATLTGDVVEDAVRVAEHVASDAWVAPGNPGMVAHVRSGA
jgi:transcription termination factor Rho